MNESKRSIFSGMNILIDDQRWATDHIIVVEDHKIKAILPKEMLSHHLPAERYEYPEDYYLVPGFIDIHVHGANGKDVMDGTQEALYEISKALATEGVTSFLATTTAAPNDVLEKTLAVIPKAIPDCTGAAVLGIHLEGPFLAPAKLGAHRAEHLQKIDDSLIIRWQEISQNQIKIVTLAPELPGAIACIKKLYDLEIVASIGHTDATYDQTREAIEAGARQATHLFNAMRGIHQRAPGAVTALLLANDVSAEIIVDHFHLHPAIVELSLRLKGKNRLILVTDAMRAKCLGDGQYGLGGQKVIVAQGKASLENGTLAGSTLRMTQAIQHMVQCTGCSLIDAVNMATVNPAHALGLGNRKGHIEVGMDADLVVLNNAGEVQITMREGEVIFSASRD